MTLSPISEKEYYLLHLGPTNDGYADHYDFDLTRAFFGTEGGCVELFLSDMKRIYSGEWERFCPQSDVDINVDHIKVNLLVKDKLLGITLPDNGKTSEKDRDSVSLKLLDYSTNGGLNSGFGAILLPKGKILKVSAVF